MRTLFATAWLVKIGEGLLRLLAAALPAAALWSFANAVMALPAAAQAELFRPYFHIALPGSGVPTDLVPMVIVWPLVFVSDVIRAALAGRAATLAPAGFTLATVILTAAANLVTYLAQDERNRAARAGVALWMLSLALNLGDVIATAVYPGFWLAAGGGASLGAWVRVGEIGSSVGLLTVLAAIRYNRVRPDVFFAIADMMGPVRRGLTWRVAVAVVLLPKIAAHIAANFAAYIVHGRTTDDFTTGGVIVAALVLAAVVVVRFVWAKLGPVFGLIQQFLLMRPRIRSMSSAHLPAAGRRA